MSSQAFRFKFRGGRRKENTCAFKFQGGGIEKSYNKEGKPTNKQQSAKQQQKTNTPEGTTNTEQTHHSNNNTKKFFLVFEMKTKVKH